MLTAFAIKRYSDSLDGKDSSFEKLVNLTSKKFVTAEQNRPLICECDETILQTVRSKKNISPTKSLKILPSRLQNIYSLLRMPTETKDYLTENY